MGEPARGIVATQRPRRRGRAVVTGIVVAVVPLLAAWSWGNPDRGLANAAAAYRRAEEVLTEGALVSFREELPHRWQRSTDSLLRPMGRTVPDVNGPRQLASLRRDLASPGSGVVLVPEGDRGAASQHRKWLSWLGEACRVLGFDPAVSEPTGDAITALQGSDSSLVCPELWVDEAWPPSSLAPVAKHPVPAWSAASPRARGLVVLQARLLKDYAPREIKALLGYELARAIFVLPTMVPHGWGKRVSQAYMSLRFVGTWQQAARRRHWLPFLPRRPSRSESILAGGPIQSLLGLQQPRGGFSLDFLRPHRPSVLRVLGPWLGMAGEAALFEAVGRFKGSRGRSLVLTLDRAAALAAGDARSAASALLRTQGLLPPDVARTKEQLDSVLETAAATAKREVWEWRREAALLNPEEPRAEVRVLELLQWAETEVGQRLLALAQMRRVRQRRLSWIQALRGQSYNEDGELETKSSWSQRFPWLGYVMLVVLLMLPFATSVDAVRWASLCTLVLTSVGVLLPFVGGIGVARLSPLLGMGLAGLLVMYGTFVCSIWWNHLLGGWRRWAKLSAELSAQLLDQADVTAGIAYLARDWAELARRSLAALDQELCGSWRTSLHELASKLTDLRQELEVGDQHGRVGRAFSLPALPPPASNSSNALVPLKRGTTSALPPPPPLPLWQKVDRAVQRAAQVEASRMRSALDADPEQVQAMQCWWRTGRGSVSAAELALCQGLSAPQETLGEMLLSERLHLQFPYPSFHCEDLSESEGAGSSRSEAAPSSEDFRRLERSLQQNLASLQELRGRLTPWENTKTALFWTWADVHAIASRFQRALRWPPPKAPPSSGSSGKSSEGAGPNVADNPKDQLAEFRMMSCLFLASFAGVFGALALSIQGRWGWVVGTFSFGIANAVLLLNYSRLYLPHVRRRFERRLVELSRQQEAILQEVNMVQKNSQRARMVHNKAAIFLQSVNVIRNMNYLALCVKTEVQRAAAGQNASQARHQRQRIAACGLQLMLALLPHSDPQWRQEAFQGEDCASVAALLYGPRRGGGRGGPLSGLLSNNQHKRMLASFEEAQKRLWILFRMVHLSSVLPCEVHGQLGALVERYLRPVLVERRVPLDRRPTLEAHDSSSRGALLDAAQSSRGGTEVFDMTSLDEREEGGTGAAALAVRDRAEQEASWSPGAGGRRSADSDAGSVDEDSLHSFYAGSSASLSSRRSGDRYPVDTGKVLRKLTATSADISKVLARLPAASLVGPSARSPQSDSVLSDIFSAIILVLPGSCLTAPGSTEAAVRDAAEGRIVVAVSTGYRYADRSYPWHGLQTSLTLEVAIAPQDARDLGVSVSSCSGPREVSVPLTMMLDEEPPQLAATSSWNALTSLRPLQFGEASLRNRRRSLRRAKDVLRSMGGGGHRPH